GLLTPPGVLTRVNPKNDVRYLIQLGLEEARNLGAQDIGQAVVIEGKNILARETNGGTNDLIRRAGGLARDKHNLILIKAKKPKQDRRVDLPTIGLETVQLAAEHGFSGIALEAGHSLLVDKERAVAAADAANIFIAGV
ncbi:MAG: LpxI family protein, partial [Rhodospirillales bacterium]|nr:LpxI family protein [Rhodospirillales bacterium]